MQHTIKEMNMIKQFSIDIKTDLDSSFELEREIDKTLTMLGFNVMGVNWRATWNNEKDYEKGFGPDSSD